MTEIFDDKATEFHAQAREYYLSELNDGGVRDVQDYFETVGAFNDGRITDKNEIREMLSSGEFNLDIFYRVAPTSHQDVMMASLNPGMQNSIHTGTMTEGEYGRERRAGNDFSSKAETVAKHQHGFFQHSANRFDEVIDILRQTLDLMDSSSTLEEYVKCENNSVMEGFWKDVCYTWPYKLATPGDEYINDLPGPSRSAARERFAEEIFDVVDPDVLVSVSKQAWWTVWEHLDNPTEEIEAYSDHSPVTKSFGAKLGESACSSLYRIESEDLWVITTFHASHWIRPDRLKENARILNGVR